MYNIKYFTRLIESGHFGSGADVDSMNERI